MSIETEIKVALTDLDGFCRRLEALHAESVAPRHFEDNHLLDFPDARLRSRRCIFRVRIVDGRSTLTFKGEPRPGGIFKVREELETGVVDGTVALGIFERMGMRVSFRYQKYRREYALDEVRIAVDETPIGNYAELEGSEEAIRGCARRLGLGESQFIRGSYFALYQADCRARGVRPQDMVF